MLSFDPNIWHQEEELRKQVESFARCFIITGQEAPESAKKFHLDLYKKTMSADGIMGRKPYGYTTRMFHIVGWKRLEVNRMLAFLGVNIGNFNSVFRRGFIHKGKARFVNPKFLVNYPDHEKDGIFPADPSLSKFLATSQASIAGLRLQWAFERTRTKEDCYHLIEEYCNGGDNYITEDIMRSACGIPLRQRQVHTDTGVSAVLVADAESQKEASEKETAWDRLRAFLVKQLLDKLQEHVTWNQFRLMKLQASDGPNLLKSEMARHGKMHVGATAIIKHKLSKTNAGGFIPKLMFQKNFENVCGEATADNVRLCYEEQCDLRRLRKYSDSQASRRNNAKLMQQYFEDELRACAEGKVGRKSAAKMSEIRRLESNIEKIKQHEKSLRSFLGSSTSSSKAGDARRRMTRKTPTLDEGHAESELPQDAEEFHSKQVQYHFGNDPKYSVRSRRYASGDSAQAMSRRLQAQVLDGHTYDLDIRNCCSSLPRQIVAKLEPQPPLPDDDKLLEELARRRDSVISRLSVCQADGKETLNAVMNGGTAPDNLKDHEDIKRLQKLSLYARWVAVHALYDDYMLLKDNKKKPFPSASIFLCCGRLWKTGYWMCGPNLLLNHWGSQPIFLCISTVYEFQKLQCLTWMSSSRCLSSTFWRQLATRWPSRARLFARLAPGMPSWQIGIAERQHFQVIFFKMATAYLALAGTPFHSCVLGYLQRLQLPQCKTKATLLNPDTKVTDTVQQHWA